MDVDLSNAVLYGESRFRLGKLLRPELVAQIIRPELVLPICEVEAHTALVVGGISDFDTHYSTIPTFHYSNAPKDYAQEQQDIQEARGLQMDY